MIQNLDEKEVKAAVLDWAERKFGELFDVTGVEFHTKRPKGEVTQTTATLEMEVKAPSNPRLSAVES